MLRYICRWFHGIESWSVSIPAYIVLDVFDFVDVWDDAMDYIFRFVFVLFVDRFICYCRRCNVICGCLFVPEVGAYVKRSAATVFGAPLSLIVTVFGTLIR